MVKNVIKVFARLKKETPSKQVKLENYIISKSKPGYEDLVLHHSSSELARYSYYQFRYLKVFDQSSSQKEVFDIVAKPVVSSVIHGFNGTIFAYGQTGSGKTYSITGCPKIYENRGVIPRCIEHIFEYLNQNPDVYTVHLSYLEIYNEIGYDLLNPKQIASKLEEFPRVLLLEDGKGEAHLRNLSIHPVSTEKEAMRLLFLGDTNRTIAETPMNEYSSRSHCIFTIYLSSGMKRNDKNVKSKLHIVDLAGSERIRKSNITGTTLNEARNINLSLHYLEQVILALSSTKKGHIPFRNSMLTYLLRDSLCGNSLTTMLATLAVSKKSIEETISTCRFSRRVSMISTDPTINEEEFDSQQEICLLHKEISELKSKLAKYESSPDVNLYYDRRSIDQEDTLNQEKQEYCKKVVSDFMNFRSDVTSLTIPEFKFCMEFMRDIHSENDRHEQKIPVTGRVEELENILRQKDEEILTLKELLEHQMNSGEKSKTSLVQSTSFKSTPRCILSSPSYHGTSSPPQILKSKSPRWKYENDIEEYNVKLESKYEEAKASADIIEQCKENIINIRTRLEHHCTEHVRKQLNAELYHQQDIYRKTMLNLREIEKETNHLKLGLLQVEMKLQRNSSRSRSRNGTDVFFGSPLGDQSVHRSRVDKYQMTRELKMGFEQTYFDSSPPSNEKFETRLREDLDESLNEDYNQAEKEDEGTYTLLPNYSIKNSNSTDQSGDKGKVSQSFLEMLVEQNVSSCDDYLSLGYPLENGLKQNSNMSLQQEKLSSNDVFHQKLPRLITNNRVGRSIEKTGILQTKSDIKYSSLGGGKMNKRDKMLDLCYSQNTQSKFIDSREQNHSSKKSMGRYFDHNEEQLPDEEVEKSSALLTDSSVLQEQYSYPAAKPSECDRMHKETDSAEFKEFMKSVPLTGDPEVDEEIFNFYRSKFKNRT